MADGNVGRVNVELGLDDKNLKRGIKQAVQSLEKIGDSAEAVGRDAEQSFNRAGQATQQFGSKGVRVASDLSRSYMGVQARVKGVETATERYKREMESLNQATNKAQRNLSEMGRSLQSVGTKMSMSVTLPLVATSAAAIKVANDFEFSMASIVGLVGVASDEVQAMEEDVRRMGKTYGVSATQAADALFYITSAGLRGADATSVLEQASKASAIGLGETAVIADLATSALNAYGSGTLSASEATDVMVATVREGKLQANELAGSMSRVLPLASAMGVGFNEVGAAFAALSRTGTDASEAATQIRGILSSLLSPTKQAEDALTGLGLSSATLRQVMREDGLLAALGLLAETFKGNEEAAAQVFGNIRALSGVLDLMGANVETTTAIFGSLENVVGDTDKAFAILSETGSFKVKQAMAQMKDAFLALGQTLAPIVLPVLGAVTKAISGVANVFNALPGPIKTTVVVIGGLVAATGPLLIALGAVLKAWTALKVALASQAFANLAAQAATAGPIIAGVAIAITTVAVAWSAFRGNAQAAQERQEALTAVLKEAGDEAATLTDRVGALIDEYNRLNPDQAENPLGASDAADAFTLAQLSAKGYNDEIASLGVSIADVTATVQGGTDWFGKLERQILHGTGSTTRAEVGMEDMMVVLNKVGTTGNYVVDSLIALYKANGITGESFYKIIGVLDEVADAWDDHRKGLEDLSLIHI